MRERIYNFNTCNKKTFFDLTLHYEFLPDEKQDKRQHWEQNMTAAITFSRDGFTEDFIYLVRLPIIQNQHIQKIVHIP